MAGTWVGELFDSRPGSITYKELQSSRRYGVTDTEDQDDVVALAEANVPAFVTVGGATQFIRGINYNPMGGGKWEVMADYGFTTPSWELSGDSGGASAKVIRALETIKVYQCQTPAKTAPDFRNGIGVTRDGIEGVDIVIPRDDYTITQKYSLSALSGSFLNTLRLMTGRTNADTYTLTWGAQSIVFGPEELLFLGRTFKQTSSNEVEIGYKLSGQETRYGGTVTAADFTQPAINATVTVTVDDSDLFTIGDTVWISTHLGSVLEHGIYIVDAIPDATHLTLEFTGNVGATAPGGTIVSGSLVSLDELPIFIGTSGPITKRGHHYLWTYNLRQADGISALVAPKFAVVQKVYRTGDFTVFGL